MPETASLYEQIKSGQWSAAAPSGAEKGNPAPSVAVSAVPYVRSLGARQVAEENYGFDAGAAHSAVNLGSMPDFAHFVGRQDELTLLRYCIARENCRLFAVLGLPGVGKSALAAAFVQAVNEDDAPYRPGFEQIIWRSLAHASSCVETLQGWLAQLEPQAHKTPTSNFEQLISQLFGILGKKRCLLVLDGVDEVALDSSPSSEAYHTLFRLFFQRSHRSCLLLTSRSRPRSLTHLDERNRAFRWLRLDGLAESVGASLLADYGLRAAAGDLGQLCQRYAGNPLVLIQASNLIHDLFEGDVTAFLQENLYFLGEIGLQLHQYLDRLTPHEARLLHFLASSGNLLNRQTLWQAVEPEWDRAAFLLALHTLQSAFLIRVDKESIALPPLLYSYFQEHRLLAERNS